MKIWKQVSVIVVETILNVVYLLRKYWKCFSSAPYNNMKHTKGNVVFHSPSVKFEGPKEYPTRFETRNCYPVQDNAVRSSLDQKIDALISNAQLDTPGWRVCFGFDDRLTVHKKRDNSFYVEDQRRVLLPMEFMRDFLLLSRCKVLNGSEADISLIQKVHSSEYLQLLSSLADYDNKTLDDLEKQYESVYLCKDSLKCVLVAIGTLLQVVDSVMSRESQTGFALIRPPGHHANSTSPGGFCLVNNIAIAAKYAIEKYKLKRVLIVDWDVHHGDGTQEIFYEDPQVLYISIHRYENATFFPKKISGNYDYTGHGAGVGFNVNIPWNEGKMRDSDYIYTFFNVVLPIAYEFNPDLVLVSAGFDAADTDLLGGCKVTPQCFGHLTHWLCSLAGGRVVLALEGGYNTAAVSYCSVMCIKALLGDPLVFPENTENVKESAISTIQQVIDTQKHFWKCLKFTKALPEEPNKLIRND